MPFLMRRILGVLFGVIEMLFFGGIMYGFNALYPVLQQELIYADLCENKTSPLGCDAQIAMFANALTTFSVIQMVMLIVVGLLIDHAGLRIVKIGFTIIYFLGTLMFAFMTPGIAWIIFPAGCFTCVGGMGMAVCNFTISRLFTVTSVLVLAFITGAYDASSSVLAIVTLANDAGLPFKTSFLILGFVGLAMGLFSGFFILTSKFPAMADFVMVRNHEVEYNGEAEVEETDSYLQNSFVSLTESKIAESVSNDQLLNKVLEELYPTRRSALKSLPFLTMTGFFSLALLRFTFFLAELTPQALEHFNDGDTVSRLGQVLSFTLVGGILAGLLCGAVIDKLRAAFRPTIDQLLTEPRSPEVDKAILWFMLRPMAFAIAIMGSFATIVSCLVFVADERAYYANFFFLVVMRGFLFSTFSSSIMAAFPVKQFGTLYGIGGSFAGAFSCIQYALLLPKPTIGNGIALGISICIFIPAIIIFSKSSRTQRAAKMVNVT